MWWSIYVIIQGKHNLLQIQIVCKTQKKYERVCVSMYICQTLISITGATWSNGGELTTLLNLLPSLYHLNFWNFNTFSLLSFFIHLPSFLLLKTAKNNTYSIRKQKYYSNEWSDRILKILLFLSCHVRSLFSLGFMFDILVIYLENVFACIVNYIVATPLILAYLVDQLWSLVFIPSFMVTNSILHLPNWKEYIKWLI